MANKTIGQLPEASAVTDATLIPIEQGGTAMSVTGALLKAYIESALDGIETALEDI